MLIRQLVRKSRGAKALSIQRLCAVCRVDAADRRHGLGHDPEISLLREYSSISNQMFLSLPQSSSFYQSSHMSLSMLSPSPFSYRLSAVGVGPRQKPGSVGQELTHFRSFSSSKQMNSNESPSPSTSTSTPTPSSSPSPVVIGKQVKQLLASANASNSNSSGSGSGSGGRDTTKEPLSEQSRITPPFIPPPPKRKKKVRNFVFAKFVDFVEGYNTVMEKNFPRAMTAYRVFLVGVKDFAKELGEYVKVSKKAILSSNGVRDLTTQELDVYYRMPTEMFRVGPTLLISALPFMNYIMFPIAYYFPKRLLSSHFWSLQQKSQFAIDFQRTRLFNYRPVFRSLQANVVLARDKNLQIKCQTILDKLGSGSHPTIREIMDIKPLFESDPFSLQAIYGPHVKALCRMHGIHTMYWKRWRLKDRAEMLHVMDTALIRDGIFNLKPEDLKTACFLRGLNASNTSHEHMVEYLQQWSSISTSISPHSYSLLLHLPILLAYNNPNNWALLTN